MYSGNLGKTRINLSNFIKLRDDETSVITAAKCRDCKIIINSISEKRLSMHRLIYVDKRHSLTYQSANCQFKYLLPFYRRSCKMINKNNQHKSADSKKHESRVDYERNFDEDDEVHF